MSWEGGEGIFCNVILWPWLSNCMDYCVESVIYRRNHGLKKWFAQIYRNLRYNGQVFNMRYGTYNIYLNLKNLALLLGSSWDLTSFVVILDSCMNSYKSSSIPLPSKWFSSIFFLLYLTIYQYLHTMMFPVPYTPCGYRYSCLSRLRTWVVIVWKGHIHQTAPAVSAKIPGCPPSFWNFWDVGKPPFRGTP